MTVPAAESKLAAYNEADERQVAELKARMAPWRKASHLMPSRTGDCAPNCARVEETP